MSRRWPSPLRTSYVRLKTMCMTSSSYISRSGILIPIRTSFRSRNLRVRSGRKTITPFDLFNTTLGLNSSSYLRWEPPSTSELEPSLPKISRCWRSTTSRASSSGSTNSTYPSVCQTAPILWSPFTIYPSSLPKVMDDSPISRHFFTHQLRTALAFCNLDLNKYQGHSFRIGAATTAASSGYSELQIQNMGRWCSNAFHKYIRIPALKLWA